jgi:16S rRNA (cytosine1402-N4)-methyltransferase
LSSEPAGTAEGRPGHAPVLLAEAIAALRPLPGSLAVDATVGRGGHAIALLRAVREGGGGGSLLAIDRDRENLAFAGGRLAAEIGVPLPPIEGPAGPPLEARPPLRLVHADFGRLGEVLTSRGLAADLVLADLGVSSTHFDDPSRGFSFRLDGPLDMRLDRSGGATAADLVAGLPEADLAEAILRLGEEPLARRIARKIAHARAAAPITTTSRLAELVRDAYGPRARASRMHPATRTFMALRIAVNDELGSLHRLLEQLADAARRCVAGAPTLLAPGARIGVISFHSLEDRMVKRSLAALAAEGLARLASRRPIEPRDEEREANPRARSAKLRAATVGDPRTADAADPSAGTLPHDP